MTVTALEAGFEPGKIIALHLNYPSRIAQRGRTPGHPSFFMKPTTSLAVSARAWSAPPAASCSLSKAKLR